MANEVLESFWSLPEGGYDWRQARVLHNDQGSTSAATDRSRLSDEPHWVLTSGLTLGTTYRPTRYAPLREHPALFRTFADLPWEDRDALLKFANRYGDLGMRRTL